MQSDFWHDKWHKNEIGFHEPTANPLLIQYFKHLELAAESHILVPLCGKSHDVIWLESQGYFVTGVELSPVAVEAFMEEHQLSAETRTVRNFTVYEAGKIQIWVGDIFSLNASDLKKVDAIYDRAALVALPETMRSQYIKLLKNLSNTARQLLINYEYDTSLMEGPPFSISDSELSNSYGTDYSLERLHGEKGQLKGNLVVEKVWRLLPTYQQSHFPRNK